MIVDRVAHRAEAARLADRYYAEQCERLGPIKGVPAPRRAPALDELASVETVFMIGPVSVPRPRKRAAPRPRGPSLDDFDPRLPPPRL